MVVAIWGSTFVFTKLLLLGGLTPGQIFTQRFIIAYLLLLGYSLLIGKTGGRPFRLFSDSWRDELLMLALGVAGGSLYFLTENSAMNYTTTTNTSLIVCACPLFAMLLFALTDRHEHFSRVQVAGSLMACAGMAVVVLNGHFVLHLSPLGDLLAFSACLCWAVYSLLMIPATKRYNTIFITRKVFFYGLVSMIPYFMVYPGLGVDIVISQPKLLANLLFLGCIASMACFLAWNWVLKKLGALICTNYVYFNPVVTVIFAWAILSEQITLYFVLGTAFILTGMYLAEKHHSHQ